MKQKLLRNRLAGAEPSTEIDEDEKKRIVLGTVNFNVITRVDGFLLDLIRFTAVKPFSFWH